MKMTELEILQFKQYDFEIFTCDQLLNNINELFLITNENDKFYKNINENQDPKYFDILIYKPLIERFLALKSRINDLYINVNAVFNNTHREEYALLLEKCESLFKFCQTVETLFKESIHSKYYDKTVEEVKKDENGQHLMKIYIGLEKAYTEILNETKLNNYDLKELSRLTTGCLNQLNNLKNKPEFFNYVYKPNYEDFVKKFEQLETYVTQLARSNNKGL